MTMDVKSVLDLQIADIQSLVNQFLATKSKKKEYWDGVYASDREIAQRFMEEFLSWLRSRGEA